MSSRSPSALPRRAIALALAAFLAGAGVAQARPVKSGPVEVGSARGVAGQKIRGSLKIGEHSDGSPLTLPVTIITGRSPGPVVWVEACVHGDEYGGARALQDVVRGLDPERMSGTLVAVPIANPAAFQGLLRVNPDRDDLTDIGGTFPGRTDRFATERLAAALTSNVEEKADYFIDLHTGGDRFKQHPFVLYTPAGGVPAERYDDLARSFGVPTLWRDTALTFKDDAVAVFSAAGIPAFLLEVGGGQPLDPDDLRLQAEAVRSLLRRVGLLPGSAARLPLYHVVTGYRIVTNDRGGLFEAAVKAGDRIREGSVLGTMTDAQGDVVETLRAPAGSDIVLGVSTYPAAPSGGWLLEVGSGLTEMKAP